MSVQNPIPALSQDFDHVILAMKNNGLEILVDDSDYTFLISLQRTFKSGAVRLLWNPAPLRRGDKTPIEMPSKVRLLASDMDDARLVMESLDTDRRLRKSTLDVFTGVATIPGLMAS